MNNTHAKPKVSTSSVTKGGQAFKSSDSAPHRRGLRALIQARFMRMLSTSQKIQDRVVTIAIAAGNQSAASANSE